jgi:hypothetical protein
MQAIRQYVWKYFMMAMLLMSVSLGAFQIVAGKYRGMAFRAPECHSGLQSATI